MLRTLPTVWQFNGKLLNHGLKSGNNRVKTLHNSAELRVGYFLCTSFSLKFVFLHSVAVKKKKSNIKLDLDTKHQEPITRSVHLHYICDPTYAQIELFLDMCFPRTSVSTAVRIWPNSTLKKVATKVKSCILRPFSSTIFVPFRLDFGHMRTATETDVRGKQF